MPLRHYNPHTGRRLVTINLTGVRSLLSCSNRGTSGNYCLHVIALGRTVAIGHTYGIVRAFGFVGRVFQVTIEPVSSAQ